MCDDQSIKNISDEDIYKFKKINNNYLKHFRKVIEKLISKNKNSNSYASTTYEYHWR